MRNPKPSKQEVINRILELKEFLEEKKLTCYITESMERCVLYCNGFSVKYYRGSYLVMSMSNSGVTRNKPDIESVYLFITGGFKPVYSDTKQMMKLLESRKFGKPVRVVQRIKSVFPLNPYQFMKIKKLLEEHPDFKNDYFARKILDIIRNKKDLVTVKNAVKEVLSMIPKEIPLYYHIHIPISKNEMINNEISVCDFVLLNAMYEYPCLLYWCWNRRANTSIVPHNSVGKKVSSPQLNKFSEGRRVPKDFWKDMQPYKDKIFDEVLKLLVNTELPKTEMSGRGKHILREIAACYGLTCVDYSSVEPVWMQSLISYFRDGVKR